MTDKSGWPRPRPFRRFAPYRKYKNSGLEWLGDVPAHWKLKRLKTLASVHVSNVDKKSEEGQVPVRLCNYVDVYYNDFITAETEFMNATATPYQVRRFRLRTKDVLITKDSEAWNDIAIPAVVAEELADVVCGYHLALVKPWPGLDGRFLARQFAASGVRDQFHLAANGITRFGLGGDAIRTGLFPVPPIDEQEAIADFLDRETAKIDALVAKKEQLIKLLKEKRTAIITRAVTRGLDPRAPMKDSAVEWLGAIPAHWRVLPLRRVCATIATGGTPPRTYLGQEGTATVDWFTPGDFTGDLVLRESARTLAQEAVSQGKVRLFPAGSVCVVGIGATLGRVGLIEEPAFANQQINVLVPLGDMESLFLAHVLSSLGGAMRATANCATLPILNQQQLGDLVLPVPSLLEQKRITSAITSEARWIEELRTATTRTVTLLNEYRIALISAAVTGRIDVRATPSLLSDDEREPEASANEK